MDDQYEALGKAARALDEAARTGDVGFLTKALQDLYHAARISQTDLSNRITETANAVNELYTRWIALEYRNADMKVQEGHIGDIEQQRERLDVRLAQLTQREKDALAVYQNSEDRWNASQRIDQELLAAEEDLVAREAESAEKQLREQKLQRQIDAAEAKISRQDETLQRLEAKLSRLEENAALQDAEDLKKISHDLDCVRRRQNARKQESNGTNNG